MVGEKILGFVFFIAVPIVFTYYFTDKNAQSHYPQEVTCDGMEIAYKVYTPQYPKGKINKTEFGCRCTIKWEGKHYTAIETEDLNKCVEYLNKNMEIENENSRSRSLGNEEESETFEL